MQLTAFVFAVWAVVTGVLAAPNTGLEERGKLVPSS